jgi:hypothetical protein
MRRSRTPTAVPVPGRRKLAEPWGGLAARGKREGSGGEAELSRAVAFGRRHGNGGPGRERGRRRGAEAEAVPAFGTAARAPAARSRSTSAAGALQTPLGGLAGRVGGGDGGKAGLRCAVAFGRCRPRARRASAQGETGGREAQPPQAGVAGSEGGRHSTVNPRRNPRRSRLRRSSGSDILTAQWLCVNPDSRRTRWRYQS